MKQIGRFLQPVRLIAPAILGSLALTMAAWFTMKLLVWSTVSIGSIVLGLFFFAFALASFAWVFPRGCKPCGALLEDHFGVYPPGAYDALVNAVGQPHPQTSAQLAPHRVASAPGHRALVRLQLCPKCQAVGAVQVEEQTYRQNQYWHAERASQEVPVTRDSAAAVRALCG